MNRFMQTGAGAFARCAPLDVIVALVCVIAAYIGVFAYKHIKQDIADSDKKNAKK